MLSVNVVQYSITTAHSYFSMGYHDYVNLAIIITRGSSTTESTTYSWKPYTSSSQNQFGDKDCTHVQFKGAITVSNLAVESQGEFGPDFRCTPPLRYYECFMATSGIMIQSDYERFGFSYFRVAPWRYHSAYDSQSDIYIVGRVTRARTNDPYVYSFIAYRVNKLTSEVYVGYPRFTYPSTSSPQLDEALDLCVSSTTDFYLWSRSTSHVVDTVQVSVPDDLLDRLDDARTHLTAVSPHPDNQDIFGDLANRIVSASSFPQVNVPAFLRDLLHTPSDVMKLIRSVRKADIKSLSDSYLSYKYGFSLTAKDTLTLMHHVVSEVLPQYTWASRKSSKTIDEDGFEMKCAYKIYFSRTPTEDSDLIDQLFQADIVGLGNTWDVIPFSFVADWFIGLGDVLEQLDNTVLFNKLPVISTVRSIRTSRWLSPTEMASVSGISGHIYGDVEFVRYVRTVSPYLITPRIAWDSPSNFNHFLESGALIVSTRYRRS